MMSFSSSSTSSSSVNNSNNNHELWKFLITSPRHETQERELHQMSSKELSEVYHDLGGTAFMNPE
jgi:hypothetical protein